MSEGDFVMLALFWKSFFTCLLCLIFPIKIITFDYISVQPDSVDMAQKLQFTYLGKIIMSSNTHILHMEVIRLAQLSVLKF